MTATSNVVLIGMPGAGKSTVGPRLAEATGRAFIDVDDELSAREGRSVRLLFDELGRDGFLELEQDYLLGLDVSSTVVATGGSAIYSTLAMLYLSGLGTVVHIDVPLAVLAERVPDVGPRGVVRQPGQELAELFEEREPLYRHWADVSIEAGDADVETVVECIAATLGKVH